MMSTPGSDVKLVLPGGKMMHIDGGSTWKTGVERKDGKMGLCSADHGSSDEPSQHDKLDSSLVVFVNLVSMRKR